METPPGRGSTGSQSWQHRNGSTPVSSSSTRTLPRAHVPSPHSPQTPSQHNGPSQQLLRELNQLCIRDQASFRARLDQAGEVQTEEHREALRQAALRHDDVRKTAEAVRETIELQHEIDRAAQLEAEQLQLQEARRAAASHQLKIQQERLRATEEAAAAAEREAQRVQQAHHAALERTRREAETRRADEARQAAEREAAERESATLATRRRAEEASRASSQLNGLANTAVAPTKPPAAVAVHGPALDQPQRSNAAIVPSTAGLPDREQREIEHQRYLAIHQNLKQLRQFMANQGKQDANLKRIMGDSRRSIRKCVGQLTGVTTENKAPMSEVVNILKNSLQVAQPQVNVSDYIYQPPTDSPDTKGPALLIYLLNAFAKAVIAQFINESSVAPKSANAIGIICSSVFAQKEFLWAGSVSLIDIFIAKYHIVCPVLFGIHGDERTAEGKRRLGWHRIDGGAFITEQRHAERMTGLGAGFASMSLRNYEKARLQSPYPPWHFWRAVADITNVPASQITTTHLITLKAMIEYNEQRILDFFGDMGLYLLRRAVVWYPAHESVRSSVAAKALSIMPAVWQRELKLYL